VFLAKPLVKLVVMRDYPLSDSPEFFLGLGQQFHKDAAR
jgi:hypothetical protein